MAVVEWDVAFAGIDFVIAVFAWLLIETRTLNRVVDAFLGFVVFKLGRFDLSRFGRFIRRLLSFSAFFRHRWRLVCRLVSGLRLLFRRRCSVATRTSLRSRRIR